jgi:hypothetical protein
MDKGKAYPLFTKNRSGVLAGVLHSEPDIINYYENFNVHARQLLLASP